MSNPVTHDQPTYAPGEWKPDPGNRIGETVRALMLALAITLPMLVVGGWVIGAERAQRQTQRLAAVEQRGALERLLAAAPGELLPVDIAVHGRDLFHSACAACHHRDGIGVKGLGKDLVHSWFVAALDDDAMLKFLRHGRPADAPDNETRMPMPANGGRDDLTDDDVRALVVYMRGLQDPRRMPDLPEPGPVVAAAPTQESLAWALQAADGDEELAEYIAYGASLYASSCAACHGRSAEGVAGNGKPLVNNPFCDSLDDDELLAFIKRGRDPGDPSNTTGVGMPAKGGNPALDDDDLLDIITYLRALPAMSSNH